jgi:hypothetical protein
VVFIDDFLHITWIYFLESWAQVLTVYQIFPATVHTQSDSFIRVFCADSVREYFVMNRTCIDMRTLGPNIYMYMKGEIYKEPPEGI